jgi:hypothetical protein
MTSRRLTSSERTVSERGSSCRVRGCGRHLGPGCVALVVSLFSLGIQRESARAATLSAEEAKRANWLTEQRLLHEVSVGGSSASVRGANDQPDTEWLLTRRSKNTYVLRNVGNETATHVRVIPESVSSLHRNPPEDATIRPQESVEFLLIGAWGKPVPNEIMVASGDNDAAPQVVPVPA